MDILELVQDIKNMEIGMLGSQLFPVLNEPLLPIDLSSKSLLFYLINFPLFCIIIIFFFGLTHTSWIKEMHEISLWLSAFSFIASISLLLFLNKSGLHFQSLFQVTISPFRINGWFTFGVDYISMSLIVLTNLFIYLCILSLRFVEIRGKYIPSEFINKLFFIQWGLLGAFSSLDLLGFFVFFEATLLPIFMIILQGGSRERKTRAGYLIALYTLFGSVFMLFNIIYLLNKYGTTNYIVLYSQDISQEDQKILWITFFLAFAAKIPVFPFHIWLPEAHVEAPTVGSVLLAALLLKLGVYGMIRFGLPLFPYGQEYFKYLVVVLTVCSFFYTNLTAIRQVDIKKIIAYSSVVHMNLIVLGILCISVESLDGAIYQMLAHGIVSGALFFCIGVIYERFKSRFLWYYGGVAFILPIYSIFLFIFILANISFPTTSNFIGEMLLFFGIFKDNFIIGVFAALSMFWGVIYNIWTYNRICFGNIKFNYNQFATHSHSQINLENNQITQSEHYNQNISLDLDKVDFFILFVLTFFLILTGIYSPVILDYISINSTTIIDRCMLLLDPSIQTKQGDFINFAWTAPAQTPTNFANKYGFHIWIGNCGERKFYEIQGMKIMTHRYPARVNGIYTIISTHFSCVNGKGLECVIHEQLINNNWIVVKTQNFEYFVNEVCKCNPTECNIRAVYGIITGNENYPTKK